MPLIKNPLTPETVAAPPQPHLAILTQEHEVPEFQAIPIGSVIAIVLDPKDMQRGILPLALMHVGKSRLLFRCPCGQDTCDRKVVFNATWSGQHPRGTPEISVKK